MNQIIRSVSQLLKIKQDTSLPLPVPAINNSLTFIRSSQRYTNLDISLSSLKNSPSRSPFSPQKPSHRTPSPNPSLSSSKIPKTRCEKINCLLGNIERLQIKSKELKKSVLQDQISLRNKKEFMKSEKNQRILKKFNKDLLKCK